MNVRLAYLLSKKLTGEISDDEVHELNNFLTSNPELYKTIHLLEVAWQNECNNASDGIDVNKLIKKLHKQSDDAYQTSVADWQDTITSHQTEYVIPNRWLRRILPIAAVLIAGFSIWWVLRPEVLPENRKLESLNQVTTMPGNRTHVTLLDGTKVWLNSDSKLTYANDFNGHSREVNLSGEAFFDVVSNPEIPFIIHSNKVTIKVTGTSFNLRDYPGELKTETSLMSGKLEVRLNEDPLQVFYLKPNEKITLKVIEAITITSANKNELLKPGVSKFIPILSNIYIDPESNRPVESAWVNDQLAFNDESFREVADKMEKWYGVNIVFGNEELEVLRFGGKFKNESLTEALTALQFATPFHFEVQNKTIIITNK